MIENQSTQAKKEIAFILLYLPLHTPLGGLWQDRQDKISGQRVGRVEKSGGGKI